MMVWRGVMLASLCVAAGVGLLCLTNFLSAEVPVYQEGVVNSDIYGEETLPSIGSGKNVELKGTTVKGPVMTGKNIQGSQCMVGEMIAGENLRITACQTGKIIAADAVIHNSDVDGSITVRKNLELSGTRVKGDVSSRGDIVIDNSAIEGILTASGEKLVIKGSQITSIRFNKPPKSGGSQLIISGGSVTGGPDGKTLISVQGNGRAVMGEFTVEGVEGGTQVITPEHFVYLNGQRTSEAGPLTYATYKQRNSEAPHVAGPQWTDGDLMTDDVWQKEPVADQPAGPSQVIELYNRTEITGDIVFGSGNGLVRLINGSTLKGKVVGGTVENP